MSCHQQPKQQRLLAGNGSVSFGVILVCCAFFGTTTTITATPPIAVAAAFSMDPRATTTTTKSKRTNIQYRPGTSADSLGIAWQMAQEFMNPLGIDGTRFVVASTTSSNARRIGWAQIRPLLRSGEEAAVQEETDDVLWDEFEQDTSLQVPVGWQSLPWTREYRAFAAQAAAKNRGKRRRDAIEQQVRQETPALYELASVWVDPAFRHQGMGTQLVQRVLHRHCVNETTGSSPLEQVYLLTLDTTVDWYRDKFGFEPLQGLYDVPPAMQWEVQAGQIVTGMLGKQLVCMQGNTQAFHKLWPSSSSSSSQQTSNSL